MKTPQPVGVGIDVSKEKLDVAILASDHSARLCSYANTVEGVTTLSRLSPKGCGGDEYRKVTW